MASGVIVAAEEAGLSVPDDVALVGFDDAAPAGFMRPRLTTIRQPFYEMGKRAAALLLDAVNALRQPLPSWHTAQRDTAPIREFLPTRLIVRDSCGATRRRPRQHARQDSPLTRTPTRTQRTAATAPPP